MTLRWRLAGLLVRSSTSTITPQDLNLVAVFLWGEVAAPCCGGCPVESDLVAPSGQRLGGCRWSWVGGSLWGSLSFLPVGGRCDGGGPGYPLRAADDSQVFSVGAVVDAPAIGATLRHRKFCAFAAHVVQPDHTFGGGD